MRMIKKLFAFLPIILIGCTEQHIFPVDNDYNDEPNLVSGMTRSVFNNDIDSIYFVSEEDINSYIKFKKLSQNKKDLTVVEIDPLTNESGNIYAYVINYSEGWEIIAADKRYTPVIGQSDVGFFKYEETIEPIEVWLNSAFEDIELLRYSDNLSEVFTESAFEKMDSYQEFWNIITANQDYIEANRIKTRVHFDPGGIWELTDVVIDTIEYQRVDHLITTHWHQDSPYDSFCPLKSYSSIYRAPAGCVAIAGAQMAYYLHGKIGRPELSPLNAFCNAQIPSTPGYYYAYLNNPHMYVSNFSATAWNQMGVNDSIIAALIAHIGICVSMKYKDTGSSSYLSSLYNGFFLSNDINCISNNLNGNTYSDLYDNVLNELPVVALASCQVNGETKGHVFIIDGYKNERVRITITYTWVPLDPENANYYEDRIVIRYNPPFNHQITMNWGGGNTYPYDAGWYSPAGEWHVSVYNFNNDKKMIYNFSSAF